MAAPSPSVHWDYSRPGKQGFYLSFTLSPAKCMRTKWKRSKYFCRWAIWCMCALLSCWSSSDTHVWGATSNKTPCWVSSIVCSCTNSWKWLSYHDYGCIHIKVSTEYEQFMKSLRWVSLAEYSPSGAEGLQRSDTSLGRGEEQVTWATNSQHHPHLIPSCTLTGAVVVPQQVQFSKTLFPFLNLATLIPLLLISVSLSVSK